MIRHASKRLDKWMRGLDKWNKDIRKSWEDFKLSCLECKRELLSHKLMAVLIIKF